MAWWDDTWLNESFASWLGEKVTDRFRPDWGVAIDRASNAVGRAGRDSLAERAAHPPADHVEGRHLQRLRRRDLREGRGRARDGRGLARRGGLPPRRAELRRAPRRGQRHGRRLHLRALGGRRPRRRERAVAAFLDQTGAPVVTAELRCDGEPRLALSQRPYRALGSPRGSRRRWSLPVCARVPGRDAPACTVLAARDGRDPARRRRVPGLVLRQRGRDRLLPDALRAAEARRALETGALTRRRARGARGRRRRAHRVGRRVGRRRARARAPARQRPRPPRRERRRRRWCGASERSCRTRCCRASRRWCATSYGERARSLGWAVRPGEGEDVRLLRRSCCRSRGEGRDPSSGSEAAALVGLWLDGPLGPRPRARDDRARRRRARPATGARRAPQAGGAPHDRPRAARAPARRPRRRARAGDRARAARARRSTTASTPASRSRCCSGSAGIARRGGPPSTS